MDDKLLGSVVDKLAASAAPEQTTELVLAACEGQACLDARLGGAATKPAYRPPATHDVVAPAGAYLQAISAQGFRGIGPYTRLELTPGPGLTVVAGRSGSGKSSFAEAFELLLTGEVRRWKGLSKVWREGWRNMHAGSPTTITAELAVEGRGRAEARRKWTDGAELEASDAKVQFAGNKQTGLDELGWAHDLTAQSSRLS